MAKLERSLRDPDAGEGEDIYIAVSRHNIVRMQLNAEADPQNRGIMVTIGNMIGQLKINEKRSLEAQKQEMENCQGNTITEHAWQHSMYVRRRLFYRSSVSLRVNTPSLVTSRYRYMPLATGRPAASQPFQWMRW